MKTPVFYGMAVVLHLAVLFGLAAPAPNAPPLKEEKKYIEVTLTAAPPPTIDTPLPPPPSEPPPPVPVPQDLPAPPPVEEPPPKPVVESPPVPPPPSPPEALTLPTPAPVPSAPEPLPAPVSAPAPVVQAPVAFVPATPPAPQYVNVSTPSIKTSVEAEYPLQARRQHQQGTVTLGLYINELGSLDKVEIIKSSGYPLLDAAAVDAIRQYRFNPAYQGTTPMRAHAEITLDFQLR